MLNLPTCFSPQSKSITLLNKSKRDYNFSSWISLNDNKIIHSLQGSGIFVSLLDSKMTIFTMSIPLDTAFACPCLLIDDSILYMAINNQILSFDVRNSSCNFHSPLETVNVLFFYCIKLNQRYLNLNPSYGCK